MVLETFFGFERNENAVTFLLMETRGRWRRRISFGNGKAIKDDQWLDKGKV